MIHDNNFQKENYSSQKSSNRQNFNRINLNLTQSPTNMQQQITKKDMPKSIHQQDKDDSKNELKKPPQVPSLKFSQA